MRGMLEENAAQAAHCLEPFGKFHHLVSASVLVHCSRHAMVQNPDATASYGNGADALEIVGRSGFYVRKPSSGRNHPGVYPLNAKVLINMS